MLIREKITDNYIKYKQYITNYEDMKKCIENSTI